MRKPLPRRWAAPLSLLACCVLLSSACSSSSDVQQPITDTPNDYCQAVCQKAHACNDATDAGACRSGCASELAGRPPLRGDFLAYVGTCIAGSLCLAASAERCKDEAYAQLAPSKYGQTLCAEYAAARAACDPNGNGAEVCFTAAKSYDDSALKVAHDCLAQSCTDLSDCLAQAVPDVALPH